MADATLQGETRAEARADARHHQDNMIARRNVGLKVIIGIVTFDLLILKFGFDAGGDVTDVSELTWAIRVVSAMAFVVLMGMLIQIEVSNHRDRIRYRYADARAKKMQMGQAPPPKAKQETFWASVGRSWATTWPLLGVLCLTAAIWWLAGLIAPSPS
jgi:hypothetical protein